MPEMRCRRRSVFYYALETETWVWNMSQNEQGPALASRTAIHDRIRGLIPRLPPTITIYHYSYLGQRPQGKLGPMHPDRLAAWDADFAHIAARGRELSR